MKHFQQIFWTKRKIVSYVFFFFFFFFSLALQKRGKVKLKGTFRDNDVTKCDWVTWHSIVLIATSSFQALFSGSLQHGLLQVISIGVWEVFHSAWQITEAINLPRSYFFSCFSVAGYQSSDNGPDICCCASSYHLVKTEQPRLHPMRRLPTYFTTTLLWENLCMVPPPSPPPPHHLILFRLLSGGKHN